MKKCLDEGTLRAYADGELPEARMCVATGHLGGCAACQAKLENMEASLRRMSLLIDTLGPEDLAAVHAAPSPFRWVAGVLAAAVAACIVLYFAWHPIHGAQAPATKTVAKTEVKPLSAAPVVTAQSVKPGKKRVRHTKPAPSLNFVALAGADPVQVGMVVRVRLPVSDASFAGVREVAADVMIGEDGRARAIRFLE